MKSLNQILESVRIIICLVFFAYASWSDFKKREVSNKVWALFAPVAFALTFYELYVYDFSQLSFYGICFGLTTVFAVVLFYSGGFGGADAKALMCLALMLPFYPTNLLTPVTNEISPISLSFFPLSIFNNSVLLAALTAVVMLLYNVVWRLKTGDKLFSGTYKNASAGRKLIVILTGYKASVDRMKQKWHVYPLEDIEENTEKQPERKLLVVPKDEGRDAVVKRLDDAVKAGRIPDNVWATPGLPFLIFITVGLLLALFVGDIIWALISILMPR